MRYSHKQNNFMSGIFWDTPSEEDEVASQPIRVSGQQGYGLNSGEKGKKEKGSEGVGEVAESKQQEQQNEGVEKQAEEQAQQLNVHQESGVGIPKVKEEPSIWTSLYDVFWGSDTSQQDENVLQSGVESSTRTLATVRRPERKEGKKQKQTELSQEDKEREEILNKHAKAHESGAKGEGEGGGDLLYYLYPVQDGDTLQGVALRHNVTVSDLKRCNGLFGPSPMITKEELVIPLPADHPNYNLSIIAQKRDMLQKRFLREKSDATVEEANKFLKQADYDYEEAIELYEQAEVNNLRKIVRTGSGSAAVTTTTTTTTTTTGNGSGNGSGVGAMSPVDVGVSSSPVLKGVNEKMKSTDDFFAL
eukprot:TRINITY_DN1016_c0_g2_i3.p1 TRINITY_DN1016_c0_g2~~TRINITY_DN1016_c0_g2_i3.p1  ORF type:complete len:361 (+),score=110.33 TRINITY_DN1016_c0_g2_i3:361-1443(+)